MSPSLFCRLSSVCLGFLVGRKSSPDEQVTYKYTALLDYWKISFKLTENIIIMCFSEVLIRQKFKINIKTELLHRFISVDDQDPVSRSCNGK